MIGFEIPEVLVLRKSTLRLIWSVIVAMCTVLIAFPGMAQEEGNAVGRVLVSEQASVELSPALAAVRASVGARGAEARSTAAVGTPYVELQQEGVGSGFDWESNAQMTLRLGTPFNLPSHARAHRELRPLNGRPRP